MNSNTKKLIFINDYLPGEEISGYIFISGNALMKKVNRILFEDTLLNFIN